MNKNDFFLPQDIRPNWVEYPHSFCRIVEQLIIHITPWHIMDGERAMRQYKGLTERYPSRELFPFAYRQDNDDVACWAKGMGEQVFIIHDFASPGYEDEAKYDGFWEWFREAVEDMIEHD